MDCDVLNDSGTDLKIVIYRSTDDTPAGEALARWATEVVPAVREAITR